MSTVLIHGPQGCGKSIHAARLAEHFGCGQVVDDWDGVSQVPSGVLLLTNIDSLPLASVKDVRVLSFHEAMQHLS